MGYVENTHPLIPYITYGEQTTSGKRATNEDAHLVYFHNDLASFAIADGAGGHDFGEYVSTLTIRALKAEFKSSNISYDFLLKIITKKYEQINEYIYQKSQQGNKIMATTLALLNIFKDKALISNVGDSKVFLLRNNELTCLTEVHTVASKLFLDGEIEKDEIDSHPKSHILTRALGAGETVQPYIKEIDLEPNDLFIICSDGLDGFVSDNRLLHIFSKKETFDNLELNQLCRICVDEALQNGSNDNITIIAVQASKME